MRSLIALAALPLLLAQQPGKISGTVVSGSGSPLRRAEVVLMRMDQPASRASLAIADSEGRFSFPSVPPGRYAVTAQKAGYINSAPNFAHTRTAVDVSAGQEVTGVEVRLLAQAVITGKVVDEDGEPLQHVSVQVAWFHTVRGRKQMLSRGGAQTNDIGEYRIPNLMPGKVYLYAMRQGSFQGLEDAAAVEEGYPLTFYPGVLDGAQALPLELTAGNELRGIDFRLRRVRTFHIRGQITDFVQREKAGPNFGVYAIRNGVGQGPTGASTIGDNGVFDLAGLAPGSYTVIASRMVQNTMTNAAIPVELGNRNIDGLSITIGDGVNLRGVVKLDNETKVDIAKLRVALEPVDLMMGSPSALSAADGTFNISSASPTRYRVVTNSLPMNCFVKSVRAGQQELPGGILDLSGGAPGELEIVLSDKAARVTGTIQPKDSGIRVLLLAKDGARQATTNQNGAFAIPSIVPGEYSLLAIDGVEEGAWDEPEFLQKYESKATKIKLGEGASETVQLTVVSGAERP